MKFEGVEGAKGRRKLVFKLTQSEKQVLLATLSLYPLLNDDFHLVSRTDERTEEQKLLREAMAERRRDNKTSLQRLRASLRGLILKLSRERCELLLQALNDVRVGSWIQLGRPKDVDWIRPEDDRDEVSYRAAMDFSGLFQMVLLNALECGEHRIRKKP